MIGSVGLYLLFAMLFLFYYYADAVVSEDKNENNDAQDVEAASTKADKDVQDDAGDVNELGTTIVRKKKLRKLGTSMRRILVNQVRARIYTLLFYMYVDVFFLYMPLLNLFSSLSARCKYYPPFSPR
jgi:hypothetical protein